MTEPVRHQVRQLSGSGGGVFAGQGADTTPVKPRAARARQCRLPDDRRHLDLTAR
jgi:hypothetical protein